MRLHSNEQRGSVSKGRDRAGFVLAGGKSKRMGRDKALLEFRGEPLALRAANLLRPWISSVRLVGAPERPIELGLPFLSDIEPARGPLGGIVTALERSHFNWNLILACDMPFIQTSFLQLLADRALESDTDVVIPRTSRSLDPLCAAYHRRCLPVMRRAIGRPRTGVLDALKELYLEIIGAGELAALGFMEAMFADVDTPEELATAAIGCVTAPSR